jgi:hypothetical protein
MAGAPALGNFVARRLACNLLFDRADMTPYDTIAFSLGTITAAVLGARLAAWHDAMVAHERRLGTSGATAGCGDECPHAEAPALWREAVETFGARADDLAFLRARAAMSSRRR